MLIFILLIWKFWAKTYSKWDIFYFLFFGLFLFYRAHSVEYGSMTHEKSNFMEENEAQEGCKWDIGFVVGLFGYTFYFPLPFGFIFIGFYKYSFAYAYSLCTRLNIKQIRKICLNKRTIQ